MFYVLPCVILFLCFSVLLALRLPRLGKRELILVLFRTFVRFVLIWICRFPLPLGVWEGLRFVIVALPGLFSYPFFFCIKTENQTKCRGHRFRSYSSPASLNVGHKSFLYPDTEVYFGSVTEERKYIKYKLHFKNYIRCLLSEHVNKMYKNV